MSTEDHIIHDEAELMHELEEHDEWFRHGADEPHHQEAHGSTNIFLLGGFLAATVLFVFATSWVLVNLYFLPNINNLKAEQQETVAPMSRLYDQSIGGYAANIAQLDDSWNGAMTSGMVIDADKGTARIPVESAMRLVIEQYKGYAR